MQQPPYQQPPYQQPPFQPPPQPPVAYVPATPPPLPRDVSVMDALKFTTSGPSGWMNVLFCALCYLSTQIVPILGLIVMQGFFAEVHRRLVLRHPEPYLRFDFSDLGPFLSRGVGPFVVSLLMALPFVFIGIAMSVATIVGAPLILGELGVDAGLVMLLGFGAASFLFIPILMFWLALSNAGVTRAELVGDVGKALNFGAIWAYAGRTWKRVFITSILMYFVWIGLAIVGLIACFIGIFVTATIGMIASLHLRWQIYNEYLLEGGEPIELAPWETLPSEAPKPAPYPAQYTPPPPPRY